MMSSIFIDNNYNNNLFNLVDAISTRATTIAATTTTTDAVLTSSLNNIVKIENHSLQNMSEENFYHGPKRDTLAVVIPMTFIYGIIFITGVIGNICTCVVIRKHRSMHTATNYYLFSLAVSDFLLLISGVPQEMYFIWSRYPYAFGEYFCIGRGLVAETSANATVLTITAFTVERFIAICHPFHLGQGTSKLSRAIRAILLIWIISILAAIPIAAQFGVVTVNGIEKCVVVRNIIQHSFQISTLIFFFAPMSIILVLYLLIGLHLHRSHAICSAAMPSGSCTEGGFTVLNVTRGGSDGSTQNDAMIRHYSGGSQLSAARGRMSQYGTRRVLKMLVAVVTCFFFCWAPFHAQRLIAVYGSVAREFNEDEATGFESDVATTDNSYQEIIYAVMTYVSGVLYYLSTCINPFLYHIMSNKFRTAFKNMLFGNKSNGSMHSFKRNQGSQISRRHHTLSSCQRDSIISDLQAKQPML